MTWFAFNNGHPDIQATGLEEKILVGYLFHGYATKAQADAKPNSVNLLQEAELKSFDLSHAEKVGAGAAGGSTNDQATIAKNLGGTLLGPLFQSNIWLRVGEVALGLILIAVGVAKLTNAVPIASKIARVVK